MPRSKPLVVRLPEPDLHALATMAAMQGVSLGVVVRQAVRAYLARPKKKPTAQS